MKTEVKNVGVGDGPGVSVGDGTEGHRGTKIVEFNLKRTVGGRGVRKGGKSREVCNFGGLVLKRKDFYAVAVAWGTYFSEGGLGGGRAKGKNSKQLRFSACL